MSKEKLIHNHGLRSFTIGTDKEGNDIVLRAGGHVKTKKADDLAAKYPRELSLVAAGSNAADDSKEIAKLKAEIKALKAVIADDAAKPTPTPAPAPAKAE